MLFLEHKTRGSKGQYETWASKSQVPGGLHVEKSQVRMRIEFWGVNRVFETQDVSLVYSFKKLPTNYIVWGLVSNANFSPHMRPSINFVGGNVQNNCVKGLNIVS